MSKRGSGSSWNGAQSFETMTFKTDAAKNYKPYKYGQVTKYEAGTIYRNVKNGNLVVKPEMTQMLYSDTDSYIRFADERYRQDRVYYDRVYTATALSLDGNYKTAQLVLNDLEKRLIKNAGKKSIWYKYKKK